MVRDCFAHAIDSVIALISALGKGKQPEQALEIYKEVHVRGVVDRMPTTDLVLALSCLQPLGPV